MGKQISLNRLYSTGKHIFFKSQSFKFHSYYTRLFQIHTHAADAYEQWKKKSQLASGSRKKIYTKKISSPANKRENATNPHKYELFSLRQSKPNYSTYTSLPNNSRSVKNSHEKKEDRLEKKKKNHKK